MTTEILKMPRLGETMDEGQITNWFVEVGEEFKRGQPIIEIETDKTVVEYPALGAGKLEEILAFEGDLIAVGAPIAKVALSDGPDWTAKGGKPVGDPIVATRQADTVEADSALINRKETTAKLRVTPAARHTARRQNIELTMVTGSGRRGRIEKSDVLAISTNEARPGKILYSNDIAYIDSGPLNGPLFLLIHGYSGDRTTYAGLAKKLNRVGIRTISLDLPGHGATRLEAGIVDDLFANLDQFAAEVMDQAEFHIVAHSLGTIPAVALAETCKIASLTLITPAGLRSEVNREFITGMAEPISTDHVSQLLQQLTVRPVGLSKSAVDALYKELTKGRLVSLAGSVLETVETAENLIETLNRLPQKIPVRVFTGHRDEIVNWQDVLALSPSIAIHHFTQSGHMPHWDQQREVRDLLVSISK